MTASLITNRLAVTGCLALAVALSACKTTPEDVTQISSSALITSGAHVNAVTLDGNVTSAEWSDATATSFTLCHGSIPVTLYVKNDATDLYFAAVADNVAWRFNGPPGSGNDFLNIGFNNNLGMIGGDNTWNVRGGDGYMADGYNPNGIRGWNFDDRDDGGTDDFAAGVTHTNPVFDGVGTYQVEYRGVLNSADDAHDFSLAPGDTIGFQFMVATLGNCTDDYVWPPLNGFEPLRLSGGAPPVLLPDGSSCTTDGACASNHCVGGLCCNSPCDGGVCQTCAAAQGATADGVCTTLGSSHTCRAAVDTCDKAEACDGTNPTCPADAVAALGTTCRTAAGPCDLAEACDGGSTACPTDGFAPMTRVCHVPAGPCESTQSCTGTSAACPASPAASPTCTFSLHANASRVLMANAVGATTINRSDDQFDGLVDNATSPLTFQVDNLSPFKNTFAARDWTVLDVVSMTVGAQVQGTSSLGHLTARVQCDASTPSATNLSLIDANNTFAKGVETLDWSDLLTVTSSAATSGPVQFLLELHLDSTLTNMGEETTGVPPAYQTYVYGTAAAGSQSLSLMDSLAMPLATRSITAIVTANVGDTLPISGRLQVQGSARLKLQTPVSVTADASNTAIVRLTPITAGASYTAASGRGLYAPDAVAPTVHIVEPDPGEIVRGVEPVIVRARDDVSGVALVQVWAGSTPIGECHQAPCRVLLDTRRFPEGPLVLRASARDFEGNVSRDDHQYVVVDNKRRRAQHCDDRYGGHW